VKGSLRSCELHPLWKDSLYIEVHKINDIEARWRMREPSIDRCDKLEQMVWVMVFNATFNNISVISWRSVLLVEETGVSGENHRPATSYWQILSHNVISSTPYMRQVRQIKAYPTVSINRVTDMVNKCKIWFSFPFFVWVYFLTNYEQDELWANAHLWYPRSLANRK
jgi:hypothetical protein